MSDPAETKVVEFDAAHLSDAIGKAAKVAPSKGAAFDKAGGIVMEVGARGCRVKSTNLNIFFIQTIPVKSSNLAEDEVLVWRLQSKLLAPLTSSLHMDNGQTVTFYDKGDSFMRLKQGPFVARVPTISSESAYPDFHMWPLDGATDGNQFASRVGQVSWNTLRGEDSSVMSGVRSDGVYLYATDKYSAATVECAVGVPRDAKGDPAPITIPVREIASILRDASDVKLVATTERLIVQLDAETQITCLLMQGPYPNVRNIMRQDANGTFAVNKEYLIQAVQRMLLAVNEDDPLLTMTINGPENKLLLEIAAEKGEMVQDEIAIDTDWPEVSKLTMGPRLMSSAVGGSKAGKVDVHFGHPNPEKWATSTIIVKDASGYECHFMNRKPKV